MIEEFKKKNQEKLAGRGIYELNLLVGLRREDKLPAMAKEVREWVEKAGGEILEVGKGASGKGSFWVEKRRLAYSIKKDNAAYYVYAWFVLNPENIEQIRGNLKLEQNIIRFVINGEEKIASLTPLKEARMLGEKGLAKEERPVRKEPEKPAPGKVKPEAVKPKAEKPKEDKPKEKKPEKVVKEKPKAVKDKPGKKAEEKPKAKVKPKKKAEPRKEAKPRKKAGKEAPRKEEKKEEKEEKKGEKKARKSKKKEKISLDDLDKKLDDILSGDLI